MKQSIVKSDRPILVKNMVGIPILLQAPAAITAAVDDVSGGIILTASAVTGADSYTYYASIDGAAYTEIATGQGTTYTYAPTQAGTYTFGVTAVKGSSESAMTTTAASGLFDDVPDDEGIALMAFYEATNGDNWTDNTNWMKTATVGGWYGVTVIGGHVRKLELGWGGNNITGDIGDTIKGLTLSSILLWNEFCVLDISNFPYFVEAADVSLSLYNGTGSVTDLQTEPVVRTLRVEHFNFTGQNVADMPAGVSNYGVSLTNISGDLKDLINKSAPNANNLWANYNSNLAYTSTQMPAYAGQVYVQSNNWTQTEVDNFLSDLDTAGGSGGSLNINDTNAAPTDGSVTGVNGLAAVDSLRAKGWAVTVTGGY